MSAKSLTPSDIAFDIYVTRSDNTPLIRLFACSVIQNIVVTSERYCNIMVSDNKYVDLHGIDLTPVMLMLYKGILLLYTFLQVLLVRNLCLGVYNLLQLVILTPVGKNLGD